MVICNFICFSVLIRALTLVYIKDSSFSLGGQLIRGIQAPFNSPSPTLMIYK